MKLPLLNLVAEKAAACTACDLHKSRTNSVFHRGNHDSKIVFVGESPGATEDLQGLPFVGRAGKLLDNMIRSINLEPDDVYICNICKCRPPDNRTPTEDERNKCIPFLNMQLHIVNPSIIVALGNTALHGLCGAEKGGIKSRRGKWENYIIGNKSFSVLPTFHPAALLRNPKWKELSWFDMQEIKKKLELLQEVSGL